jgi:hypothetical protein
MSKRSQYIWLGIFAVVGCVLALGAWQHTPGDDPDNQGGYLIVLILFLVMLFMYVPVLVRWLGARLGRGASGSGSGPHGGV